MFNKGDKVRFGETIWTVLDKEYSDIVAMNTYTLESDGDRHLFAYEDELISI